MKRLLLAIALAAPALAQSVAANRTYVAAAHDGVVEIWKSNALDRSIAKTNGVETPGAIAISDTRVAVADALHNRVAIVELATGRSVVTRTDESPTAIALAGNEVLVLAHDANMLDRIAPDGSVTTLPLALDPAFLAVDGDRAYVYSRVAGVLQEISLASFSIVRKADVPPYAAAMELRAGIAYLAYPREAKIRVVALDTLTAGDQLRIGTFPMDLAYAGESTVLTARLLAISDPISKRVWIVEAQQSAKSAFMRGFLRGLLGIGLFRGHELRFPAGVDRIAAAEGRVVAFDSSTGTLYGIKDKGAAQLAKGVGPRAFTVTSDGRAVWWQNGTLVAQKLD